MSDLKRRQVLGGFAALTVGCGSDSPGPRESKEAPARASNPAQPTDSAKPPLSGRVLGFGVASRRIVERFGSQPETGTSSVLVDLDLASGESRFHPYAIAEGHEPFLAHDGLLICVSDGGTRLLFIDPQTHELRSTLRADEGVEYSGHARVIDGRLLVTTRERGTGKMRGQIDVIDLEHRTRIRTVPTGGHVPHEMVLLEDRNEIAVSHYGHFGGEHFQREPFFWDIREPVVTFLDRKTLKVKRRFLYDKPLALTHMRRGANGMLYVVTAQYVRDNVQGRAAVPAFGDDFVPSELESNAGRIGVPGAVAVLDPERGFLDDLMPEPLFQRKQQSVGLHTASGHIFVTFTYSDRVMRIDPASGNVEYYAASELGISAPCGVVDIRGTPYVGISGQDAGLCILEAATGRVENTYAVEMFSNVHLGYLQA